MSVGSAHVQRAEVPGGVDVPFNPVGRAKRVLPFAIVAALPYLLTLLFGPIAGSPGFIASGILTAVLIVAAFRVPWERVPAPWRPTVPFLYFVVVILLRNSSVTAAEVYTPLVLLPVIWLALYGTRGQLIAVFVLLALTLILPILVYGAPRYPTTEWRRVVIWLVIAPIVGLTIHRLVAATRERAEQLRASEAATRAGRDVLASVLRGSTEHAIIGTDPDGVITVFSAGAERMLGYGAPEVIGVATPEIFHDPEEVAQRARELDMAPGFGVLVAAARRGEPETRDWSYIRKNGGRVTVAVSVTPIEGPDVDPAGFMCVAYDVTLQRSVEHELRESETRHRLLIQNLPDTVLSLYDRELRLLLVEGPMLVRLGLTAEDLVGRTLSEITPAEDLGELEPLFRAALGGENASIEYRSPRQGIVYDLQVAPYRDEAGEIVGVFTVAHDVTERKRVEAQAKAAEARYATAYEHTPIGIGLTDMDGRWFSVNPALVALLGYTREELLNSSPRALTHPDDSEPSGSLWRALVAGELSSYHIEKRYLHADGHPIDVSLHVALVRDGDGKPLHVVGQILDMTEHKRHATMRERELALTEQARQQLIEQNARLVEVDRLKDEFVALVSHELRTPLTSIVAYLEPILDNEAGPLTPTQERFLTTIDRNARALSRIVGDLLFLASVDAGRLTLDSEDVDLAQVVAETVEACAPSADRRGITVTVDTDGVPTVRGDRARLAQLTDNLMSNAIKFTPDGGQVEVRGRADGSNAVIEIHDSGVGIPADEVPHLFTRFYRARSATESHISGTGLGLAIVKEITDAHHGAIEVDSSPGIGTTMRLLLPLGADEDRHPAADRDAPT